MKSEHTAPPELIELIQFYALRQEPLTLTIESASSQRGWVSVADGDVRRARTAGGKQGFEAFVEIVSWRQPTIVALEEEHLDETNVELPLPQLLMETYWQAQEHEPTDPPFEAEPTGLEEETAVGDVEFGPPDGVTGEVLELVGQFTKIQGFVAVALLHCETGELIEVFGKRARIVVPQWLEMLVKTRDDQVEHVTVSGVDYIDLVLRPITPNSPCFLLRVDRQLTNRALVEVAVRNARTVTK